MEVAKQRAIQSIVNAYITSFASGLLTRYESEVDDAEGVVNMKKNNCFIAELGEEFMFYSAFVRSFDSSFGNLLEKMGKDIAKQSFEVRGSINSFLLPEQTQRIASILDSYNSHSSKPKIQHYANISWIYPTNINSFIRTHATDNYFYNERTNEHILIELKASGDLDNKKSKAEKNALLDEYYMLLNQLRNETNPKIKILFGTAYNKFGEGNPWKQERVQQFFAQEELLIGKDYWNFICDDSDGFNIIFEQYKISCSEIKRVLKNIKRLYFEG
ncbi:MAG: TdeIII family type II restriction endonuclease [Phascolarctobacterium sp.]|nr:TdeIII family type II restriction endonuclease [Phascolarctobacterium sp.]